MIECSIEAGKIEEAVFEDVNTQKIKNILWLSCVPIKDFIMLK